MKPLIGAAAAALLLVAAMPRAAVAQDGDSFVLPRGVARGAVSGWYAHHDARFATSGTEPLAAALLAPLTSATFAPLATLESGLNRLFTETGGGAGASASNLLLGTPELVVGLDARTVPFRLEVGVLPGLELGVELPIHRSETRLTRFALSGGTVGTNPNPEANASALEEVGAAFAALGRSPLLPTASSPLGMALLERVRARAPGAQLTLPDSAADAGVLAVLLAQEFGTDTLQSGVTPWQLGDVEVGGQFRVLSSFGAAPHPADSVGMHYRVSASASVRIPTGSEPALVPLFTALPAVGVGGGSVGVEADVYWGQRVWVTGTGRYVALSSAEVTRRIADPLRPLASAAAPLAVRWDPADELQLRILPRFRITDALSVGAEFRLVQAGETTYTLPDGGAGAEALNLGGGLSQFAGMSLRYGTVGHYLAGAELIPMEAVLSYQRALSGPSGYPAASAIEARLSLFRSLWGGR